MSMFVYVFMAVNAGIGLIWRIKLSEIVARASAPVGAAFAILFAVTAFFFGVYGYRGITRGLVYQVVGTLVGALLITGIRALMGLDSIFGVYFFSEPAWVVGGVVGAVSFLFGVGVVHDWVQWARGVFPPEDLAVPPYELRALPAANPALTNPEAVTRREREAELGNWVATARYARLNSDLLALNAGEPFTAVARRYKAVANVFP